MAAEGQVRERHSFHGASIDFVFAHLFCVDEPGDYLGSDFAAICMKIVAWIKWQCTSFACSTLNRSSFGRCHWRPAIPGWPFDRIACKLQSAIRSLPSTRSPRCVSSTYQFRCIESRPCSRSNHRFGCTAKRMGTRLETAEHLLAAS